MKKLLLLLTISNAIYANEIKVNHLNLELNNGNGLSQIQNVSIAQGSFQVQFGPLEIPVELTSLKTQLNLLVSDVNLETNGQDFQASLDMLDTQFEKIAINANNAKLACRSAVEDSDVFQTCSNYLRLTSEKLQFSDVSALVYEELIPEKYQITEKGLIKKIKLKNIDLRVNQNDYSLNTKLDVFLKPKVTSEGKLYYLKQSKKINIKLEKLKVGIISIKWVSLKLLKYYGPKGVQVVGDQILISISDNKLENLKAALKVFSPQSYLQALGRKEELQAK